MKNASTVWGGVFFFDFNKEKKGSTPSDEFRVRVPGNPYGRWQNGNISIFFYFIFSFMNSLYMEIG
jgi:hypothetical protein